MKTNKVEFQQQKNKVVYLLIDHMTKGNYRCSVSICNLPCRVGDMRKGAAAQAGILVL